jgi:hypothetical protein
MLCPAEYPHAMDAARSPARKNEIETARGRRLAPMSGAAIAVGAALGLAAGIVVSLATDLPFAPEGGLLLGALLGWLSHRAE